MHYALLHEENESVSSCYAIDNELHEGRSRCASADSLWDHRNRPVATARFVREEAKTLENDVLNV